MDESVIRLDERQRCWQKINRLIKTGNLPEPQHSERNGIILAGNAIAELGIGDAANVAFTMPNAIGFESLVSAQE